jgi:hypothetical protein
VKLHMYIKKSETCILVSYILTAWNERVNVKIYSELNISMHFIKLLYSLLLTEINLRHFRLQTFKICQFFNRFLFISIDVLQLCPII